MKTIALLMAVMALWVHPVAAVQWFGLWTEDDAWYGLNDNGEIWFYNPGTGIPVQIGSFGAGPWVGCSKAPSHEFLALRQNGEIWAMTAAGATRLFLTMPTDRQWYSLLSAPESGYGPSYALTCTGEIWVASDPPRYAGSFVNAPVPASPASWGRLKETFR